MKKKLLKFFIIIGALGLLLTTISATQVQAVTLQANPNTHYKGIYYSDYWITYFRDMEKTGGALGLSETINEKTMLSTSGSNNLDSHQVKATEYGAAAILSASGYGNSKTLQNSTIKTTTGNETGVYISGTYREFVAGGYKDKIFSGVDERYYDAYTEKQESAKVGDALGTADTLNPGCAGWHSATSSSWSSDTYWYFARGNGGLFSVETYNTAGNYTDYGAGFTGYYSRGVVVCGEGL